MRHRAFATQLALLQNHPDVPNDTYLALTRIQTMTVPKRKELIRLARSAITPEEGTMLRQLITRALSPEEVTAYSCMNSSLVLSATLLMLARNAPLPNETIGSMLEDSAAKELAVLESCPRPPEVDFAPFFGAYHLPIHPTIAPNPHMAMTVHKCIDQWILDMSNTVLYPKLSNKTTSSLTQHNVRVLEEQGIFVGDAISQVTLEWIYHTTGIQVGGPAELRQRFYPTGFEPRTYFAAGGDAFALTKHLSSATCALADSLPCSHRTACVNPTRLIIPKDTYATVYDLKTFTSNMHEHRYFLYALARYCKGHTTVIMDGRKGLLRTDLGELMDQLAQAHTLPLYTASRIDPNSGVRAHRVAGFLGIYGNITTAKFLHAAIVLQVHESTDELNCAGDDGCSGCRVRRKLMDAAIVCGTLEDSKIHILEETGAIHLKRRMIQTGQRLLLPERISVPSWEYPKNVDEVDPRYPLIAAMTLEDRKGGSASSIVACLRSLTVVSISDNDKAYLLSLLRSICEYAGLPLDGHVPQVSGKSLPFVPVVSQLSIGRDPITYTLQRLYNGFATIPNRSTSVMTIPYRGVASFEANSSPHLTYLEKLGYLEREKLTICVSGEEGYRALVHEYTAPGRKLYRYTWNKEVPEFLVR